MATPNLILLYVEDPARSSEFYEKLLDSAPVASFPTYVAFEFSNGLNLGLWSTKAANFVSSGTGHRFELAFMVDDDAAVDRLYDAWRAAGVSIEQEPSDVSRSGWGSILIRPCSRLALISRSERIIPPLFYA